MTLNPRQSALIEMVRAQGSATIEELAKRFDVTLQTVRRDVNILSEAVEDLAEARARLAEIGYRQSSSG